jgi:SAM-dependent MidA family methyltransferase
MTNQSLPPPTDEAAAQSSRLIALIQDEIRREQWISFARFMALALYTPRLGYYSGGARKFGEHGDFITAPEISPLFGQALGAQVAQVMQASAAQVLEVGAGTGQLACDLLRTLDDQDALPDSYLILELSGELRARQQALIERDLPHLSTRVRWLDALPERFSGCVLANEVLDVMPVQRVVWRPDGIFERGVALDAAGKFCWQDRPAGGRLLEAARALPVLAPESGEYRSEICLAASAWVAEWGKRLEQGALLLVDYGYPRDEYYLPSRDSGTLQCYYRHHAHNDLLAWPGLNDITAFVDFTTLAEAAHNAGLTVAGYTTQASFLTDCGILDQLRMLGAPDEAAYLRGARAALRLLGPHEMGELFKVLVLSRGLDDLPWLGLRSGNRVFAL